MAKESNQQRYARSREQQLVAKAKKQLESNKRVSPMNALRLAKNGVDVPNEQIYGQVPQELYTLFRQENISQSLITANQTGHSENGFTTTTEKDETQHQSSSGDKEQ